MKIYTRHGDYGQTSLASGERVSKSCQRIESYGAIDELNAHVGLLVSKLEAGEERSFLSEIQRQLFVVGGNLATDLSHHKPHPSLCLAEEAVMEVERHIDQLQSLLPELKFFILPGGSPLSCQAHICRTVCRRAEREMLRLEEGGERVDSIVKSYVNRLSDYFFVLARYLNQQAALPEQPW